MAAWTCSACGGENAEGMRFCGHCGTPLVAAPPAADVSQTLRSFVAEPVADRPVESGGEIPQERRLITALFADVSGFTALADRLDPEDLLEVIDPVISGLSSIVGHYGGYVEKFAYVEAHAKRFHKNDPETPQDPSVEKDEEEAEKDTREEDDEPDVEAHAKRFH